MGVYSKERHQSRMFYECPEPLDLTGGAAVLSTQDAAFLGSYITVIEFVARISVILATDSTVPVCTIESPLATVKGTITFADGDAVGAVRVATLTNFTVASGVQIVLNHTVAGTDTIAATGTCYLGFWYAFTPGYEYDLIGT